ncbi:tetratricopeptide repeat protein [Acinetobacter sp. MB5]|uniref:tetratricopeptide repeat protein n=1 Tax=Acinetobacter sp. MB5 TaxID=2069438 RepID=UPI000DCFE208|nr:hypothetical protein [Acinetobacter sp. MB5]
MHFKLISSCLLSLSFVGCTQLAHQPQPKTHQATTPTEKKPLHDANGVTVTPYHVPEIKRSPVPVPPQPVAAPDGSEKPVFRQLIQRANQALQRNNLTEAQHLALQAQRISPQAAQSYVVLAQVAYKKHDYSHAQSLIQRGLSLADDSATQKQLWHIRLQIAQAQHNASAIQQAKQALSQL